MISISTSRIPAILAISATLFVTAPASNSHIAAPWIIIVHGDLMSDRAVIADWHRNLELLASIQRSAVDTTTLNGRPYLDLALFWGHQWQAVAESPEELMRLRPEQGNQHGRLYPALSDAHALALIGDATGDLAENGLALLKRYDVPVRIDP